MVEERDADSPPALDNTTSTSTIVTTSTSTITGTINSSITSTIAIDSTINCSINGASTVTSPTAILYMIGRVRISNRHSTNNITIVSSCCCGSSNTRADDVPGAPEP